MLFLICFCHEMELFHVCKLCEWTFRAAAPLSGSPCKPPSKFILCCRFSGLFNVALPMRCCKHTHTPLAPVSLDLHPTPLSLTSSPDYLPKPTERTFVFMEERGSACGAAGSACLVCHVGEAHLICSTKPNIPT